MLREVGAGVRPPPDGEPILTSWLRLLAEVDWKETLRWLAKTTIRLAKAMIGR